MPHSDTDDEGGIPLIEPLSDSDTAAPPSSHNKRKRPTTSTTVADDDDDAASARRAAKRAKRKARKQASHPSSTSAAAADDDAVLDAELGVNHALAHMDPALLSDHLAQRLRRAVPSQTAIDADALHVPAGTIRDVSAWGGGRGTGEMGGFLEWAVDEKKGTGKKRLASAAKEKGAPHTLVIAGAGLRAAEVVRVLRVFQTKESLVAKLFAKHIKLKEAVEMVKGTRMGIGVGTPQRLIDLLEAEDGGVLKVERLERIVVDASHIDQKKRGILDMRETLVPLLQLLTRKELKDRYGVGKGKVELIFY